MATHCLGEHFDIHGGGLDLQFPHHENEIAQSEAATGHKFVNVWMHNGFLRVDDEKMSKSLGNFFSVREVLAHYHPEEIRYFILDSHYRSPLNYSDGHLENARSALTRFYTALRGLPAHPNAEDRDDYIARFTAAMDDDFNTSNALAVLFDLARETNKQKLAGNGDEAARMGGLLRHLAAVLGLLQDDAESYLQGTPGKGGVETDKQADALTKEAIEVLINRRNVARKNKNWDESDRIRDELIVQGIILEDGTTGTTWRKE